jgi:hypothetical protein
MARSESSMKLLIIPCYDRRAGPTEPCGLQPSITLAVSEVVITKWLLPTMGSIVSWVQLPQKRVPPSRPRLLMRKSVQKFRVFVSSSDDVQREREALRNVVDELNVTHGEDRGVMLELVRWETHAYPGVGRPPAMIYHQVGRYDIFVGIMWWRFGTTSGIAGSATEEDFRRAYHAWEHGGSVHILFYFCGEGYRPRNSEEAAQLAQVVAFHEELEAKGVRAWTYPSADRFADVVRPHLARVMVDLWDCSGAGAAEEQHLSAADAWEKGGSTATEGEHLLDGSTQSHWGRHKDLEICPTDTPNQMIDKAIALRQLGRLPDAVAAFAHYRDRFSSVDGGAAAYVEVALAFTLALRELGVRGGVYIYMVAERSAARAAEMAVGDVIVEYNGRSICGTQDITAELALTRPGSYVRVSCVRYDRSQGRFSRISSDVRGGPLGAGLRPI